MHRPLQTMFGFQLCLEIFSLIVGTDIINSHTLSPLYTMYSSTTLGDEVKIAAQEGYNPEFDELNLQEDQEDCKLDFSIVTNEVKEASQEAISKQTIQAYKKYFLL